MPLRTLSAPYLFPRLSLTPSTKARNHLHTVKSLFWRNLLCDTPIWWTWRPSSSLFCQFFLHSVEFFPAQSPNTRGCVHRKWKWESRMQDVTVFVSAWAAFCITTNLHQFVRCIRHNLSQIHLVPIAGYLLQCLWLRGEWATICSKTRRVTPEHGKGQSRTLPPPPMHWTTCLTFCPLYKGSKAAAPGMLPWAGEREIPENTLDYALFCTLLNSRLLLLQINVNTAHLVFTCMRVCWKTGQLKLNKLKLVFPTLHLLQIQEYL